MHPRAILRALALLVIFPLVALAQEPPAPRAYGSGVTTKILLQTQTDGAGAKLVYPTSAPAEVSTVLVEIAPGRQTNWHTHPVPCFAYMLDGELSVETATGEKKTFRTGDAIAEVVNVLHNGTNSGPAPARLILFVIGTAGQPFAVRPTPPPR
jgi:quercetin dioxygenase-like cupin family protein